MDQDFLKSNWNKIKGDLKLKWEKLTNDDLLQIEGQNVFQFLHLKSSH